jgi:hypothetical protein
MKNKNKTTKSPTNEVSLSLVSSVSQFHSHAYAAELFLKNFGIPIEIIGDCHRMNTNPNAGRHLSATEILR